MPSQAALDLIIGIQSDGAEKGIGKLSTSILGLGKNAVNIGGVVTKALGGIAVGGAIAGVGALSAALVSGIGDAREATLVNAQTEAAIKSMGNAAGVSSQHVQDFAASLSAANGKSLFGDSQYQESTNLLLTFDQIKGATLDLATTLSGDLAQALGGAPADQALMLGKALNSPAEGMGALRRVGLAFTADQEAQVKALQASGDMMGAQSIIIAELNKQVGGSAEAAARADGGMAMFKDRIGEVAESLGASLLPAMNGLMGILNSDAVQSGIQSLADALGTGLQTAVSWLGETGLPALKTGFDTISSVVSSIVTPVQDAAAAFSQWSAFGTEWGIVAALQSIGESFPLVEPFTTWLSDKVPGAFETARTTIETFKTGWDNLKTAFEDGGITGAFQLVLDKVGELFPGLEPITSWLSDTLPGAVETAQGWIIAIVTRLQEWWDKIGGLQGIIDGFKTALDKVGEAIGSVTTFVNDHVAAQAILVGIVGAGTAAYLLSTAAAIAHGIATKATTAATALMTAAQTALNVVLAANPVGLLIVGLAGLAIGLKYAYDNSETFRASVDKLWADFLRGIEVIKTWAAGVKERFDEMVADFKRGWELITTNVSETWNTIKTTVSEKFTEIVSTVSTKIDEVKTFFTELPGKITTAIGNLGSTLLSAGKDLINGLIDGLKSIDVGSVLGGILKSGIAAAKAMVGIKSPSKMTRDELGVPLIDGITKGIEDRAPAMSTALVSSLQDLVGKAKAAAAEVGDAITGGFAVDPSAMGDKIKLPYDEAVARYNKMVDAYAAATKKLKVPADEATAHLDKMVGAVNRASKEMRVPAEQVEAHLSKVVGSLQETGKKIKMPVEAVEAHLRKVVTSLQDTERDISLTAPTMMKLLVSATQDTAAKLKVPVDEATARLGKMVGAVQATAEDINLTAPTMMEPLVNAVTGATMPLTQGGTALTGEFARIVDEWNRLVDSIKKPDFKLDYDRGENWDTGGQAPPPSTPPPSPYNGFSNNAMYSGQSRYGGAGVSAAAAGMTTNTAATTINYATGAITVIAAPGEDPRALAERLMPEMDRIQRQRRNR